MKTRLLITLSFFFSFLSMDAFSKTSCYWGPRYVGKIIVVDQNNEVIKDALVCKYTGKDSVVFYSNENRRIWNRLTKTTSYDSTGIHFYGYRYYSQIRNSGYKVRVSAEGYADLYLDGLKFENEDYRDTTWKYPVLYVTMHAAKFVKLNNQISKVECFNYSPELMVKDTTRFNVVETKSYKDDTREAQFNSKLSADYSIKTYPNPVIEEVSIVFKEAPILAQKMVLFTIDGRKLKSYELTEASNKINMSWLNQGVFLVVIYDERNSPIHQEKLTKR